MPYAKGNGTNSALDYIIIVELSITYALPTKKDI